MRGFGNVLLGIGVLVLLATFTIGVARNLSLLVLVSSSDTRRRKKNKYSPVIIINGKMNDSHLNIKSTI